MKTEKSFDIRGYCAPAGWLIVVLAHGQRIELERGDSGFDSRMKFWKLNPKKVREAISEKAGVNP